MGDIILFRDSLIGCLDTEILERRYGETFRNHGGYSRITNANDLVNRLKSGEIKNPKLIICDTPHLIALTSVAESHSDLGIRDIPVIAYAHSVNRSAHGLNVILFREVDNLEDRHDLGRLLEAFADASLITNGRVTSKTFAEALAACGYISAPRATALDQGRRDAKLECDQR